MGPSSTVRCSACLHRAWHARAVHSADAVGYLSGAASQSSTSKCRIGTRIQPSWLCGPALRAVDRINGKCTYSETLNQCNPWWKLAFRELKFIDRVEVLLKDERGASSHARVKVDNQICGTLGPTIAKQTVSCGGKLGLEVSISLPRSGTLACGTLAFCEVMVFGRAGAPVLVVLYKKGGLWQQVCMSLQVRQAQQRLTLAMYNLRNVGCRLGLTDAPFQPLR